MEPVLSPEAIRAQRIEHAGLRERDLAARIGISEAALVAAETGLGATRIDASPARLLEHVKGLGEVMVLTRNESAIHEKIGVFEDLHPGKQVSMTLGANIDLRIFGSHWVHGFAVEKADGEQIRRSLQFFDGNGQAVFKIHLRPQSDIDGYARLVAALRSEDQSQVLSPEPTGNIAPNAPASRTAEQESVDQASLREHWQAMTDPHQFFSMLKKLKIARQTAIRHVGEDFAWQLDSASIGTLLDNAARDSVAIMCFVANAGCVQIHTGSVSNIQRMGPWLNIMDPTFHLHLRQDHISEVWAVRKPADNGAEKRHVTSVEAYDASGNLVIQFFGKRKEGAVELESWRELAEALPRPGSIAA